MTITRTTELEAINTMLNCVGESPVNSIEVTGFADVYIAKSVLLEISRAVQEEGWYFNRDEEYPLLRNASNRLAVPPNALRIDATDEYAHLKVVQRGAYLYSKDERSFTFDEDIEVNVVWFFPWNDLPESARRYILIRAARVFQARQLGSDTQHKFSEAEEFSARANMNSAEGEVADYNVLYGSYSVANILDR